jgi:pimeloyl-ACP methyl ester carboxylesterase
MIEDARGHIDYTEEGSGPTVVLVPGSWGTRSAWRAVMAALDGRFRFVTTSLLGYGGTEERRSESDVSIDHEAAIIEAVIRHAGGAVHLVGHSYGALACLAVAIRRAVPLLSLSLLEPTGVNLLRRAGQFGLHEQISAVRDAYFRAFASGEKEAARHIIDLHDGEGSFDALPPRVRDYIVATTRTNILDWRSGMNMDEPLPAYAAIAAPSLILRGGRAHPYVARSAEILCAAMPNASLEVVPGAAHSMMSTHGGEVARLIRTHISKAEPPNK